MEDKLSGMMKTVHRLKKIVHSLLYISRIENDQYAKNDTVSLHRLIEEVMEELSPKLEMKSIEFLNNTPAKPEIKNVNHDLFFQLLYNLINNAIRYNKANGSIQLTAHHTAGEPYMIFIKDTGIGIAEEELPNIFNRFKKSSQAEGEGYGLGLSIVKSIAVFHRFEIKVQSVFGEGTVFTIVVPGDMLK
jgi:signal transduction histidine kinase